jgi:hypothetical protein
MQENVFKCLSHVSFSHYDYSTIRGHGEETSPRVMELFLLGFHGCYGYKWKEFLMCFVVGKST